MRPDEAGSLTGPERAPSPRTRETPRTRDQHVVSKPPVLNIGTANDAGLVVYDLINGFEFDGATQFKYIDFRDTLKALLP